ncbi:MAG: hypothetical protein GJT30_05170 [Geobacter sp.]|nr:hypothetical protein [Geobacter sp.]
MACEIIACCRFISEKMDNMPMTSHYKKNRHCLNDYESCTRYLTYKSLKKKEMIEGFYLDDVDEIGSVINCLKRGSLPSV